MAPPRPKRESKGNIGLPPRPFLYTLGQVADLVATKPTTLDKWLWYEGRNIGPRPRDRMVTRSIAPATEAPAWRVAENELLRWLKVMGFRVHDRGFIIS